ncbi:MAG: ThuA domain-containing protein [Verrucomicrobiae bacterium]|nr:ThuA domain-containing protein [Verrucomicrobiae bacterium]
MKLSRRSFTLLFLAIALLSLVPVAAEAGPHVVFMIGEREYGTEKTLPEFFEKELAPKGFTADFITAPTEGEARNDFPGLEKALAKADLLVVSVRRRAPTTSQLQALRDYLDKGKPLIGLRTASHAFHLRGEAPPEGHAIWERFDPEVLGGNYQNHYGDESFAITPADGAVDSPLLEGVELKSSSRLYRSGPLAENATPLLIGTLGENPPEPVAWTHHFGPNNAKVFHTSLGTQEDFAQPGFRRLLANAVTWALETE